METRLRKRRLAEIMNQGNPENTTPRQVITYCEICAPKSNESLADDKTTNEAKLSLAAKSKASEKESKRGPRKVVVSIQLGGNEEPEPTLFEVRIKDMIKSRRLVINHKNLAKYEEDEIVIPILCTKDNNVVGEGLTIRKAGLEFEFHL